MCTCDQRASSKFFYLKITECHGYNAHCAGLVIFVVT